MTYPIIRDATAADMPALMTLYPAAFGAEDDLRPLVRALAEDPALWLSLTAERDGAVVGHAMFTRCHDATGAAGPVLLAPLAVHPDHQRMGIGRGLVTAARERLLHDGAGLMLVLGDPAYYGRLGFSAERAVRPPHDLPPDWDGAWQSLVLDPDTPCAAGPVQVPQVWAARALWVPPDA